MKIGTSRPAFERHPEVMNITQAAEYLGISPDTLYKYAASKILPAFKLGNRWRFRKVRLDEWIDEQCTKAMSEG